MQEVETESPCHLNYSNIHSNQEVIIGRRPRKKVDFRRRRQEEQHKINGRIRAPKVRVVGDNVENGIYTREEALTMARRRELDLVEIAANAEPPVCKIIDYSKFRYEQKKKEKELKAKAHKVVVKEIRFGPNTDDHDYEFKRKHAEQFLKDGNKVKAYVHFVGRSIVFKDRGRELLARLAGDLEEFGKVDNIPKMEGKRMIMMMSPLGGKKK